AVNEVDRRRFAGIRAHDHDGRIRKMFAELQESVFALGVGKVEIQQDDIRGIETLAGDSVLKAIDDTELKTRAEEGSVQGEFYQRNIARVIFDNQGRK